MAPRGPRAQRECLGPTSLVSLQSYTEWLQELREKGPELLKQPPASTEPSSVSSAADVPLPGPALSLWLPPGRGGCAELPPWAVGQNLCVWLSRALFCPQELASKLREAEEAQSNLQAECDQYRTILAETVGLAAGWPSGHCQEGASRAYRREAGQWPWVQWQLCMTSAIMAPPWAPFLSLSGKGDE